MKETRALQPDSTAARVALWRALHVEVDPLPHVLEDEIGLRLLAPEDGWRRRGDMQAQRTRRNRASIVARGRFIEDLVEEKAGLGVAQYVILGAGLDTFVQRRPEFASHLTVFEIDQPGTQMWKRGRLLELGYGLPDWLRLVPFDFEKGGSWLDALAVAGFDRTRSAVVASTGVSMYITKEATLSTLRQIAGLAGGSTLAMTFMPPLESIDLEERPALQGAMKGAKARGTPFISFFTPTELLTLAREAGFKDVRHVAASELAQLYFAGRTDGLLPSSGEELLIATT